MYYILLYYTLKYNLVKTNHTNLNYDQVLLELAQVPGIFSFSGKHDIRFAGAGIIRFAAGRRTRGCA